MTTDAAVWASYARGLRLQRRSEHTMRNYTTTFRQLSTHLDCSVIDATRADIESFLDYRLSIVAASTVADDFRNIRALYNWMVIEEFIDRSPCARIRPPVVPETLPRVLTDSELKALYSACRGNRLIDLRDSALLRLMSEPGGPRRAEIGSMRITDLDFRHDLARLVGKTGERWIPYSNRTGQALDRYLKARAKRPEVHGDALWVTARGAMPVATVWWIVRRRAAAAGIGHVYPHVLRHTASHRCMAAGMSTGDLEQLFGWTPGSAMTAVYGRSTRVVRAQNAARAIGLGEKF